jgi:catechol 2,3-dioxygenase-like lactoylglutathione lyase family enzyme
MNDEPIMDVAHVGHLEVLTPKPEESLRFFVDVLGMTESGQQGESVYLGAWDDYERYSLKLTGSDDRRHPGSGQATHARLRRKDRWRLRYGGRVVSRAQDRVPGDHPLPIVPGVHPRRGPRRGGRDRAG